MFPLTEKTSAKVTDSMRKASRKYDLKFNKKMIRVRKDLDEQITRHCEKNNESFNGYIVRLVTEDLKKEN